MGQLGAAQPHPLWHRVATTFLLVATALVTILALPFTSFAWQFDVPIILLALAVTAMGSALVLSRPVPEGQRRGVRLALWALSVGAFAGILALPSALNRAFLSVQRESASVAEATARGRLVDRFVLGDSVVPFGDETIRLREAWRERHMRPFFFLWTKPTGVEYLMVRFAGPLPPQAELAVRTLNAPTSWESDTLTLARWAALPAGTMASPLSGREILPETLRVVMAVTAGRDYGSRAR